MASFLPNSFSISQVTSQPRLHLSEHWCRRTPAPMWSLVDTCIQRSVSQKQVSVDGQVLARQGLPRRNIPYTVWVFLDGCSWRLFLTAVRPSTGKSAVNRHISSVGVLSLSFRCRCWGRHFLFCFSPNLPSGGYLCAVCALTDRITTPSFECMITGMIFE